MYYDVLVGFRDKVLSYVNSIFEDSREGILLELGNYNLLENENNCIETSTAIGFIMEEFLVSKLATNTQKYHYEDGNYRIDRLSEKLPTTQKSYDCSSWINKDLFAMINVKVNKSKQGSNNAIAAIRNLYQDFVKDSPRQQKCYMILKVFYQFGNSERDKKRKIFIGKTEAFFIDEINFGEEHNQDYRSWNKNKKEGDPNAGRLIVSPRFQKKWTFPPEKISYVNTCASLQCIVDRNALLTKK